MTKRIFLALLVLTLAAGGAFAQVSLGAGGNFAVSWDSMKVDRDGDITESLITTSGGGFYAFLDATYLEVDVGMLFGSLKMKISEEGASSEADGPNVSYLTLGLFGKYPIDLGGFTLFPMLGIQLDVGLSAEQNGVKAESEALNELSRLWIKFGVGADFNLSEQLYLRPSILYGLNFNTKSFENLRGDATSFNHGLDIRVALGFRF